MDSKSIAISLPRKMGAVSAAQRVAMDLKVEVGEQVGYSINLHSKFSDDSLIKYMTDTSLIKEILQDPLLRRYSAIMIDDVHERSLSTDLLLGLIKKIRRKRNDLRIIISSATVDAERLANFFIDKKNHLDAYVLRVQGRGFPIKINYLKFPVKNYIVTAARLAKEISFERGKGDILVFLPGTDEIKMFTHFLKGMIDSTQQKLLEIVSLHSKMTMNDQINVLSNKGDRSIRRIIGSTNIAESSVTIEGVGFVIDTMYTRIKYYNYYKNSNELVSIPISKSSAIQRAGRSGRTQRIHNFCNK